MRFFVGLHQPSDAQHFDSSFVSVTRLRKRKSGFKVRDWIMDSGAFGEVARHGGYRNDVAEYASQIRRWSLNGNLLAAVAQDYMCEPFVLKATGMSIEQHQRLTVERYDALEDCDHRSYIIPVLQGYAPTDYLRHLEMYNHRIDTGMWVGVGSVCKRNGTPDSVASVLRAIEQERPGLRLHGFGLKTTSLAAPSVRDLLHSADSMAWSFAARREGRNANDWREAAAFVARVEAALCVT